MKGALKYFQFNFRNLAIYIAVLFNFPNSPQVDR